MQRVCRVMIRPAYKTGRRPPVQSGATRLGRITAANLLRCSTGLCAASLGAGHCPARTCVSSCLPPLSACGRQGLLGQASTCGLSYCSACRVSANLRWKRGQTLLASRRDSWAHFTELLRKYIPQRALHPVCNPAVGNTFGSVCKLWHAGASLGAYTGSCVRCPSVGATLGGTAAEFAWVLLVVAPLVNGWAYGPASPGPPQGAVSSAGAHSTRLLSTTLKPARSNFSAGTGAVARPG